MKEQRWACGCGQKSGLGDQARKEVITHAYNEHFRYAIVVETMAKNFFAKSQTKRPGEERKF